MLTIVVAADDVTGGAGAELDAPPEVEPLHEKTDGPRNNVDKCEDHN